MVPLPGVYTPGYWLSPLRGFYQSRPFCSFTISPRR
jgi:hypothetical protein